jgi:FKBP-type peptidyl-prolyl cis-trans isomerase 2
MPAKKAVLIKDSDTVKIEYTGSFDDGEVFDASEKHGAPLEFKVCGGQVIKGFDNAVLGMKKDEEKSFRIEPKDAYGDHNPDMIKKLPKDKLPPQVKKGSMLMMQLPNGAQLPVLVVDVTDEFVSIDVNHPLAGKALNFKIKVVGIN